jgi:hypothetical protein
MLRPHRPDNLSVKLTKGRDPMPYTIKHSNTTQANRILGVFLAPNGDFTEQLSKIRQTAQ